MLGNPRKAAPEAKQTPRALGLAPENMSSTKYVPGVSMTRTKNQLIAPNKGVMDLGLKGHGETPHTQ